MTSSRTSRLCVSSSPTAAAPCRITGGAIADWPTCSTSRTSPSTSCENVYFDTCVYHQPGIDLLFSVIERKNILFGSEMLGAVRGIDPETGNYFDDTKRFIDAVGLTSEQLAEVYEGNARRVYPRLDAR